MVKKLRTALHVHTEDSIKDSGVSAAEMVKAAKDKGFDAIAITNHGNMMHIEIARAAAKAKYDNEGNEIERAIRLIYGVEAYYQPKFGEGKKSHLILMAKDRIGYQAIMKAVSRSNEHIDKVGAPIMEHRDIVEFFGKGGIGHDHVIATSACVIGVLSNILLRNDAINAEQKKIEKRMEALPSPADPYYVALCKQIDEDEARLAEMQEIYDEANTLSKRTFKALKAKAERNGDADELARLEEEEKLTEQAKIDVPNLRLEKNTFSKGLTVKKQEKKALEEKHQKWTALKDELETLEKSKKTEPELVAEAKEKLAELKKIFGKDNFYVELQNHGMLDEVFAYTTLAGIARETGTPVVAANDAHMIDNSVESIRARSILRTLRFGNYEPVQPSDRELYLKTPEEIAEALSDILSKDIVDEAIENADIIGARCDVVIPEDEKHYPVWKCSEGRTDKEELEALARKGIEWRYGKAWTEEHEKRLEYELSVIDTLGFNSYLLIVQDFLNYARMLGQLKTLPETAPTMEELKAMPKDFPTGVGVGPGRGSAVGSIVCYLTGITAVDPIAYNLVFERFLNVERVTMPEQYRAFYVNCIAHRCVA